MVAARTAAALLQMEKTEGEAEDQPASKCVCVLFKLGTRWHYNSQVANKVVYMDQCCDGNRFLSSRLLPAGTGHINEQCIVACVLLNGGLKA